MEQELRFGLVLGRLLALFEGGFSYLHVHFILKFTEIQIPHPPRDLLMYNDFASGDANFLKVLIKAFLIKRDSSENRTEITSCIIKIVTACRIIEGVCHYVGVCETTILIGILIVLNEY